MSDVDIDTEVSIENVGIEIGILSHIQFTVDLKVMPPNGE